MKKHQLFIRFGGLSSVNQMGYHADASKTSHHSPPCRRGIYAMPFESVEMFLVSSTVDFHHQKSKRDVLKSYVHHIKNSKGEPIVLGWEYYNTGKNVS